MYLLCVVFILSVFLFLAEPVCSSSVTLEDSWVEKASMPTSRGLLGVASVNGKIYAIGGNGPNGINEEFDPIANNWTTKEPMPVPEQSFAIAAVQNKIYCIGGLPTGAEGRNQVYDPATDSWENKAPLPVARTVLQANVVEGKIYLIGGYDPNTPYNVRHNLTNITYVYDPVGDIWATKASMPNMVPSVSAVVDNKIYFINSNATQIYNPKTDMWSIGTSPLRSISGEGESAVAITATTGTMAPKLIYVYDGYYLQVYNPANNSWSLGANPHLNRQYGAMTVLNDTIYLIGGFYDGGILGLTCFYNSNDQYTPFGYGTVKSEEAQSFPIMTAVIAAVVSVAIICIFVFTLKWILTNRKTTQPKKLFNLISRYRKGFQKYFLYDFTHCF